MTAVAASARRPPLTKRERRGATIAGIVGFLLATLGWIPIALLAVAAVFSYGFSVLAELLGADNPRGGSDLPPGGIIALVLEIPPASVGLIVAVVCAIGVVLIAAGIVLSIVILKRHGVFHPAGVTWLGLLLAIVGSWIFNGILGIVVSAISGPGATGVGSATTGLVAPNGVLTAVSLLIAVAIQVLLGWLCWWWMAHALRRRTVAFDQAASPEIVPGS